MNSLIKVKEKLNHKSLKEIIIGPKIERNQILNILLDSPNYLVKRLFIGDDNWKPIAFKFDSQLLKNIEEQLDLLNIGLMLHLFEAMEEVKNSNRKYIKLSKNKLFKAVGALYGSNNLIQTYHNKFNRLIFDDQPNLSKWIIIYVREVSNILTVENKEFFDEFIKHTSDPVSYRRLCVFGDEFFHSFFLNLKQFENRRIQKKRLFITSLGLFLFTFFLFVSNNSIFNFFDNLFVNGFVSQGQDPIVEGQDRILQSQDFMLQRQDSMLESENPMLESQDPMPLTDSDLKKMLGFSTPSQ
jgi:hypothetical protein